MPNPVLTKLAPGSPAPFRPGDFLLTRNLDPWYTKQGFLSAAIRTGEWLRFHEEHSAIPAPWRWNHAVCVGDGHLIEAVGAGVVRSPLDRYDAIHRLYVATDLDDSERKDCVGYWEAMVGHKYGFFTVAATGLRLVTGIGLSAGFPQHPICSGLAAAGLGIYKWRSNPSGVSPTELAIYHNLEAMMTAPESSPEDPQGQAPKVDADGPLGQAKPWNLATDEDKAATPKEETDG